MGAHIFRFSPWRIFASAVLEVPDLLLFLGVHGDHRLPSALVLLHHCGDVPELCVTVWALQAFACFARRLQAVVKVAPADRTPCAAGPDGPAG